MSCVEPASPLTERSFLGVLYHLSTRDGEKVERRGATCWTLKNALKRRPERGRRRKKGDPYNLLIMAMDRNSGQHSSSMLLPYAARDDEGRRTGYKRFLSINKSSP
jgi:hypothetical protein